MKIKRTKSFERSLKKLARKQYPISALKPCIEGIVNSDAKLLTKIKDHPLKGNWKGYREFHPARVGNYGRTFDGWIVIYKIDDNELTLLLVSTGNHDILDNN